MPLRWKKGRGFLDLKVILFEKLPAPSIEELSLGSHKAQDFDLIKRRLDLKEILPLWFALGEWVKCDTQSTYSKKSLLGCLEDGEPQAFKDLFRAGFIGMFSPVYLDHYHQGFPLPPLEKNESCLLLLKKGNEFIRRLFIEEKEDGLSLLPHLPSEFHAGRMLNIQCKEMGVIHIEWSKKLLRRVVLSSKRKKSLTLYLQKGIKTFRLRKSKIEKGIEVISGSPIELEEDVTYMMDNFTC